MTRMTVRYLAITLCAAAITTTAHAETLGLQLYSVREQLADDVPATLARVAGWGFEFVEGGGQLYGSTVDEFREALEQHGLSLVSVDTTYEELRDNPLAAVYKARFFGAKFATFYWIPHDGDRGFGIEDARQAVEVMNAAGKLLAENGITLQYHLHGYEFRPWADGDLFDVMATSVTDAKFQMDVYWVRQGGSDPLLLLKKYPGRFTSLHLKDRAPGTPDSTDGHADVDTNVVLGRGDVGIAGIIGEARRHGIDLYFLEDESSRVIEQIPASLDFLESLSLLP